jgi:hypothetical protein
VNRHLFELKNLELKGKLREYLVEARKAKKSYKAIAEELSSLGAPVGRTAVEDWYKATLAETARGSKRSKR